MIGLLASNVGGGWPTMTGGGGRWRENGYGERRVKNNNNDNKK